MKGSVGTNIKRKSIQKLDPALPKPRYNRQVTADGRTSHKDIKPPAEQLKQFRKKQLITLSTDKSLTNIHNEDGIIKQSRFDDDHHNTESIAQLLNSKMQSNLATFRTKMSGTINPTLPNTEDRLSYQKQSLGSDSIAKESQMTSKQKEGSQDEGRQGENYDDYVLGEKVEDQEDSNEGKAHLKKFQYQYSGKPLSNYIPRSESERRLEQKYWNSQRKKLLSFKEDRQILTMMQEYQNQKKVVMNQSKRKHQAARVMASLPRITKLQKLEKVSSVPILKPKQQIIVPQVYEENNIQKTKKNLLAKSFQKEENILVKNRLKQTLSYSKLGFGSKRARTICQQDIYEEQMNSVEEIRSKLRSKGIFVDSNKLVSGLTNNKNMPVDEKAQGFPERTILPSNPIYKKFPL